MAGKMDSLGTNRDALDLDSELCARYRHATDLLGKRWTGLVLLLLSNGPRRFSELSKELVDVGDRMITKRLRELESEGIVAREVIPESPVRVEYDLTEKGRDLAGVIEALCRWSDRWVERAPSAAGLRAGHKH